jgi:nucleoside-diphosphate-sugar epimerase
VATWVIVGAGYTGQRVARALALRREDVVVTRRTDAAALESARAAGPHVRGIRVDLDDPFSLDAIPSRAIVVCCAPPGRDPSAVRLLADRASRLVYVSSTGVYPPAHGAWVHETTPVGPLTESGRARVAAEAALPTSAIVLRAAGIYGPDRNLVDRIKTGSYRVVGDGRAHVSRIHVDDLVTAIIRAGESTLSGQPTLSGQLTLSGPVNVADDDPAPLGEVADEIARRLGVPTPPRVDAASVSAEIAGMLTADRRIANRRMKEELGVQLRYPSWRDGLADLLPASS